MRILAIESATPHGSVALADGERVVAEEALPPGRQASETFLAAVACLLDREGRGAAGVTHVAVSAGPGSFTGLRVGMSAAKGFAFGWSIPLVPVPTLEALAMRFPLEGATICPVLDAKKKEVYAGLYRFDGGRWSSLAPDAPVAPERLPFLLPPGPVLFCGDGILPFGDFLRRALGSRALFPPAGEELPRAGTVGLLAARLVAAGGEADVRSVVPRYIRRSEAEIKRGL